MKPNLKSFPLLLGISSAVIAVLCQSINDVAIKFLSGGYALHQVVLVRSSIGLAILLAVWADCVENTRNIRTLLFPPKSVALKKLALLEQPRLAQNRV